LKNLLNKSSKDIDGRQI